MSESAKLLSSKLAVLKREFARGYRGNSHIQEVVPALPTADFAIERAHLAYLHEFARRNPIYHNSFELDVAGTACIAYEGDINTYWLNSTKHGSSCQPFYPTWILSAYVASLCVKDMGCTGMVDVGSGDGRIAYCGKVLGLGAQSIEIDDMLVDLQSSIIESTGISFALACADATAYDYSVTSPPTAFFIGGLPQMGGDMLAESIVKKISGDPLGDRAIFVLAGSNTRRALSGNAGLGGWAPLIEKFNLAVLDAVSLPTVWTFDQDAGTPYIFAKFRRAASKS